MPRSNPIADAKARMGYLPANQRPVCRTCRHSQQQQPTGAQNDAWLWRCSLGGFGTTAEAVCDKYEPMPAPAGGKP